MGLTIFSHILDFQNAFRVKKQQKVWKIVKDVGDTVWSGENTKMQVTTAQCEGTWQGRQLQKT